VNTQEIRATEGIDISVLSCFSGRRPTNAFGELRDARLQCACEGGYLSEQFFVWNGMIVCDSFWTQNPTRSPKGARGAEK
jgi:hypothetical protein